MLRGCYTDHMFFPSRIQTAEQILVLWNQFYAVSFNVSVNLPIIKFKGDTIIWDIL